jgi:hypothetical protein
VAIWCLLVTLSCGKNDAASKPAPSAQQKSPSAPAVALVRLRPVPAKVGGQFREERTSAFSLAVEFWQDDRKVGSNESYRSEEYVRRSQVLALVGGAPAKLRVTYDKFRLDETPATGAPRHLTSLEAKSFVVDAADGQLKVSRDDGKAVSPVSPEDEKELKRLHPRAGEADPVVAALGERPMKVGASGKMNKVLLSALLDAGAGDLQDGSFTLTASRVENGREVALFDCRATTTTEESGGLEVTSHLEIQAMIAVEPAQTLSVVIKSTLEATGKARNPRGYIDLKGSGWTKEQRSYAPLP